MNNLISVNDGLYWTEVDEEDFLYLVSGTWHQDNEGHVVRYERLGVKIRMDAMIMERMKRKGN